MLDHLALAAQARLDLGHVEVSVLGDRDHVFVADCAQRVHVLDTELREAPLAAEVPREEDLEEAEHALGVLGDAVFWVDKGCDLLDRLLTLGLVHVIRRCDLSELLVRHSGQRHVVPNTENVDSALVRSAANVFGDWIEGEAVDVGLVGATTELLNQLPSFCGIEADDLALSGAGAE